MLRSVELDNNSRGSASSHVWPKFKSNLKTPKPLTSPVVVFCVSCGGIRILFLIQLGRHDFSSFLKFMTIATDAAWTDNLKFYYQKYVALIFVRSTIAGTSLRMISVNG